MSTGAQQRAPILSIGGGIAGISAAIEAGRDFIMQSVLATHFQSAPAPAAAQAKAWDINGLEAVLSVRKA